MFKLAGTLDAKPSDASVAVESSAVNQNLHGGRRYDSHSSTGTESRFVAILPVGICFSRLWVWFCIFNDLAIAARVLQK